MRLRVRPTPFTHEAVRACYRALNCNAVNGAGS